MLGLFNNSLTYCFFLSPRFYILKFWGSGKTLQKPVTAGSTARPRNKCGVTNQ
jgi:hypothetical protein